MLRRGSWRGRWGSGRTRVPGFQGTQVLPPGSCRKWESGGGHRPLTSQAEGLGPHGKRTRDSEGHAGSHPVWARCPGPRHALAGRLQDGSLEALPRGSVVRQESHMEGRQPGQGAFRWPPRLLPAPQDPATALGKQLRKSSGNKNPIPSPSHSLGPDLPTPVHPGGGPATEACQPRMVGLGKAQWA